MDKSDETYSEKGKLGPIQRYIANIGITASTLRGIGGSGHVEAARRFLADIDLNKLADVDPATYFVWLNLQTSALQKEIADLWGPARKSLNIFMTMATMNRFLNKAYRLGRFEHVMEIPLDSVVAGKLREFAGGEHCPRWTTIKKLTPQISTEYQVIATAKAKSCGVPRGRLDVYLWEPLISR